MKRFNVLDAELDLTHHYLLEASAGTGKTYSIENIILRLLLEGDLPLDLEQVLAVTFTRAAVADMRMRVLDNLRNALDACNLQLRSCSQHEAPDFLRKAFAGGEAVIKKMKRRLEKALTSFDQARIYTIHSFCAKMLHENILESDSLVSSRVSEDDLSSDYLEGIVKDFLRTELHAGLINAIQMDIVINAYKGFDRLLKELSNCIGSITPIVPTPSYTDLFQACLKGFNQLKQQKLIASPLLLEDFYTLAPFYKGVCDKKKKINSDILKAAKTFADLFDKEQLDQNDFDFLIENKGFWNHTLKEKYKKFPELQLHYPDFAAHYGIYVENIIQTAGNPFSIFSILAAPCQQFGQRILKENDLLGFNGLLKAMLDASSNPAFAAQVRSRFKAVIIDEFQDTDPLQWEIFRLLFPPEDHQWGRIFLVGDPKQSIYAFRQADIYTYLSASQTIKDEWKTQLDCNFRSEPSLINALNSLFNRSLAPDLFPLPRSQGHIDYIPVIPGGKVTDWELNDNYGSLHAYTLTYDKYNIEKIDNDIFPSIANEIRRLHLNNALLFSQFAVLVADRYQGERLVKYLREWNIPATYQRAPSLTDSITVRAMRELLTAFINPRDESALKTAMGGPFIGWSHRQVETLKENSVLQRVLEQMYSLKKTLWTEGFPSFINSLMTSTWDVNGESLEKQLLSRRDGALLYNEWLHICNWLIEKHSRTQASPEQLIDDLLNLENSSSDHSELKIQVNADENAVQVLTIHSSKGLEFDVVFAIGLYKRDKKPPAFIPIPDKAGGYIQKAVHEDSEDYNLHCREIDAEKIRRLYVALTRAKHRLYIPFVFSEPDAHLPSPIELFTSRCNCMELSNNNLCKKIGTAMAEPFEKRLHDLQSKSRLSISKPNRENIKIAPLPEQDLPIILPPKEFHIPGQPYFLKSYTSLTQTLSHKSEERPPIDFSTQEKNSHTLPAGSEAGILLHAILQNIPFSLAQRAKKAIDLIEYVSRFTASTPFKSWEMTITEIVYTALKTPLFKDVCPLAEIPDCECFREMEFAFSAENEFGFNGYLKGVVDLFFRYKGNYYLVDWKSNWLGPDITKYNELSMRKTMEDSDYFLQARIYQKALNRYLKLINDTAIKETAYIFLRGLSSNSGIFRI